MTQATLAQQTVYFLASIAVGAAAAILYDVLRAVRMLARWGRRRTMVTDILFFFVCGVLTSLFALPFNKGDVRAFVVFGEAVGFLTYRLTLGELFGRFYAIIARLLRAFARKICEKLKKSYDCLLKAGTFLLYNIADLIDKARTAVFSGVRQLRAQLRAAHPERHHPSRRTKRREQRLPAGQSGTTAYYAIPLRGDRIEINRTETGNKHEQKRIKAREHRKQTEENTPKHGR